MKLTRLEHGGGLGEGRRKIARPVSTREPMYLVLRSTRAKGRLSLTRQEHSSRIKALIGRQAEACRIEVLQYLNEGSALHFLIRVPSRACYLRFIRSVSGLISRQVTGVERGPAAAKKDPNRSSKKNRFWDILPYSRIATGATTIRAAQRLIDEEVRKELGLLVVARSQASSRATQKRA